MGFINNFVFAYWFMLKFIFFMDLGSLVFEFHEFECILSLDLCCWDFYVIFYMGFCRFYWIFFLIGLCLICILLAKYFHLLIDLDLIVLEAYVFYLWIFDRLRWFYWVVYMILIAWSYGFVVSSSDMLWIYLNFCRV